MSISRFYDTYDNLQNSNRARSPRGIVLINGISVKFINIEIVNTTFYMSDTFNIELPISGQPDSFNLNFLSNTSNMRVQIYIGFPNNPSSFDTTDLDLVFVGNVDYLTVDPLEKSVTISGRDLSSLFIDNKTYEVFSNKRSSDVARSFAQQYGLNPVVTTTQSLIGTFNIYQTTLLMRETTQWDLLCFLAQQENFVVFVQNNDLIFAPRLTQSQNPYLIQYQQPTANNASVNIYATDLKLSRSLSLANGVTVKVRVPYNAATGNAFTIPVRAQNANSVSQLEMIYQYTMPGLSPQQALQRANQILKDTIIHQVKLEITLPGDNLINKNGLIRLTGTGTSFDQDYYPDHIVKRLGYDSGGYTMSIVAKNQAADTTIEA